MDWLPEVGSVPVQSPEAAQAVAWVELQVSVARPLGATTPGAAVSVAVGDAAGGAVVFDAPAPEDEEPEWQPATASAT